MKDLLNSNNIILLLILLIIIILIQIRKNINTINNIEKFSNNISSKIDDENNLTNKKIDKLKILKNNNHKTKYLTMDSDSEYEITDKKTNMEIAPTTDLDLMTKFNNEGKNKLNNIDKNIYLKKIEDNIQDLRIKNIKDTSKNELGIKKQADLPKNTNITHIKNPHTSVTLNVKKNNNAYNIFIKNQNKKSCLTFDNNKFKIDKNNLQSYYSLTDCDKNNKNQNFNINTVQKLEKCYNYPSGEIANIPLSNCEGVNYIKKINNDEYIENYNKNIPQAYEIDEHSVELTPNKFSYLTPEAQPNNSIKQCLTIDKYSDNDNDDLINKITFKTCKNMVNQRWNITNFNSINNSC